MTDREEALHGAPSGDAEDPSSVPCCASTSFLSNGGIERVNSSWEENAGSCSICGAKLGKRLLNPRHHCRICGRNVCGGCSPSTVQLSGKSGPRRACTECVTDIEKTAEVKRRIVNVACRLRCMAGLGADEGCSRGLEETVIVCEAALEPVEKQLEKLTMSRARLEDLERQLLAARSACIRLGARIYGYRKLAPPAGLQTASLDEAVQLCEEALGSPQVARRPLVAAALRETPQREARQPLTGDAPHSSDESSAVSASTESGRSCCRRRPSESRRPRRRCLALMGSLAVAAAVVVAGIVVALHYAGSSSAQSAVSSAPLELAPSGMLLADATADGLRLNATLVFPVVARVALRLPAFRCALASAAGREFGWLTLPAIRIVPDAVTLIHLDTRLHISDAAAFSASLGRLFRGGGDVWRLLGEPTAEVFGARLRLSLNKTLALPADSLRSLQVGRAELAGAQEDELRLQFGASFASTSGIRLQDLGSLAFGVALVNGSLGEDGPRSPIGRLSTDSFSMSTGVNSLRNITLSLGRSTSTEEAISLFLGGWLSGRPQRLVLSGPTRPSLPFLAGVLEGLELELPGLGRDLVKSADFTALHSFWGHDLRGNPCNHLVGSRCLQGPIVTLQNPLHHALRLSDVAFEVDLMEDIEYSVQMRQLGLLRRSIRCPSSRRLLELRSAAGMWSYINASRAADTEVLLPGVSWEWHNQQPALMTSFLAKSVAPGAAAGCFGDPRGDCCAASALTAAACRASGRDLLVLPSTWRGSFLFGVGSFNITVSVMLDGVPLVFADDVRHLQVGTATAGCGDFTWS